MFYYVKLVGDEPVIVETEKDLKRDDVIVVDPKNFYFLVQMMTPQGQGMVPVSAEDNGLAESEIKLYGDQISMIAKLGPTSPIVEGIGRAKRAKLGIVTPEAPKIIV